MEGSVTTGSTECAMLRVEGDCVDRVNVCDVALVGDVLTVALEGEVGADRGVSHWLGLRDDGSDGIP